MADRIIYAHEIDDEVRITILMNGECDLETLEVVERWAHRQRVRICQRMKAQLDAPTEFAVDGEAK